MTKTIASKAVLNNGIRMPYLGLGTFGSERGGTLPNSIRFALQCGYRLIDTAAAYGNERQVGLAIAKSAIPRREIFVTTKVWNDAQGYAATYAACQSSLAELGLESVDLYLIHWPVEKKLTLETWKALIRLRDEGKCRAIGVSNFTIRQIEHLVAKTSVVPAVNQVEFHPWNFPQGLRDYCREHAIQLESYSPLANAKRLDDPTIKSIAAGYDKSPAQIMLRWALQHDVVVVPKSSHKRRIQENAAVFDFEISQADMAALDSLNENFRASWYPANWPAW
ncbi:MAG: aldo/keto reductase [Chloroflexi bacterium]|nr:aldo/keto reductase [Chloroflexota bacterium]